MTDHEWAGWSGPQPVGAQRPDHPYRTGGVSGAGGAYPPHGPGRTGAAASSAAWLDEQEGDGFVRPFIVTGGRTRPTDERLRVETLVTAAPAALSAPLSFERRHIVQICQRPLSVAEVATSLGVPLGVARVLIADLIAEGLVAVHDHLGRLDDYPSRSLLERIREGVRAL